jgi:hypothetical protein
MRPCQRSIPAVAVAVLLGGGAQGAAGADLDVFDEIVTRAEMAAGFDRPHPFSFEVDQEDGARVYAADVAFARTARAQRYLCAVMVTAGGRLLDVDAHQRRRARFEGEPGHTAESLAGEFPSIGRRAQRELFAFGPGGAAFGLTFTTTDGKFDVRVMLSNLLPRSAEVPAFDVDETARRISLLYDERDVLRIGRHAGGVHYAVERCGARATERLAALQATGERKQPEVYQVGVSRGLADGSDRERQEGREVACTAMRRLYGPNGSNEPGLIE